MSSQEISLIIRALKDIAAKGQAWAKDYKYSNRTNEFTHKIFKNSNSLSIKI